MLAASTVDHGAMETWSRGLGRLIRKFLFAISGFCDFSVGSFAMRGLGCGGCLNGGE